ncbi:MAG: DNA polymerase III subunit alpha [Rudaea sp.]|uniref:DNA polymerase III subunit alpha n=1 Tax=Rudaea sp. TaxID=2136325 RepID=UPI0039E7096C
MTPSFVHLHVHSDYSLVDSTIRLPDKPEYGDPAKAGSRPNLISRAVESNQPALALTDQCNLFALIKFYRAAEANGIKPIAGADIYLPNPHDAHRPFRLTLLCLDRGGYLNLARLVSRCYLEGRQGDFVLAQPDWFHGCSDGLIALAGRQSDVGHLLIAGNADAARNATREWLRFFDDRWYFELTRTGHADEAAFIGAAIKLGAELDLPCVATNDVRFLSREDFESHEARVCIRQGRLLSDPKRPRDYTAEQYLKSAEEMAELFADLPQALENSVEIAKRCNLELGFGKYYLPDFPVPAGETIDSSIRKQSHAGLEERLAKHGVAEGHAREDYVARLDRELDVIAKMGFPGYFLIVADFIGWAKSHGIPVGPGRGSGAGSVVAWSLGITDLDPLRYGLLFERFLNPERISMPDFDVDFCMDGRDAVIDYVARKYGREKVSQIITYGTMAAKAVLRDAGRVLGMGYGQVDRIAKLIPMIPTDPITLEDALGRSKKSRERPDRIVAEFRDLYETDDDARELIDLALSLEDLTRNAGKHAGGVVIAPSPLTDFAPLYSEGGNDGVVTQFDKDDVESVGLVKFDFLGLRTLTIIDWAVKAINARRSASLLPPGEGARRADEGKASHETTAQKNRSVLPSSGASRHLLPEGEGKQELDITRIPLDDPEVYALFKRAQTVAVFQFESRGMQGMLKEAKPDRFEDLMALTSLFRPGPMEQIPSFCKRKHGAEPIDYPDARVEPVLAETYGIMVYQEQVMQMAQIVGGYSLGGADLLRRAMGKKNPAEMAKQREIFRDGAAKNGVAGDKADAIFDLMEKFAGYGFNKSHAAAYALVSYQTAWLKVHYPAEFMAAVLSSDMDNTDKVVNFLDEARAMGVMVRPPDVNASVYMFRAEDDGSIRYGLGAIKGVGRAACESIAGERERDGAYKDLADFCHRVDPTKLNKRVLEALVLSGALDALGHNRASLMAQVPEAMKAAEQQARDAEIGQVDIFGATAAAPIELKLTVVDDWPLQQKLIGERETLGHYLSGHPTEAWRELLVQLADAPIGDVARHYKPPASDQRRGRFNDQPFTVAGQVVSMRNRGDAMAFVQLEDWSGRIEVSLFREVFTEYRALLTRDAILVVEGGLSVDEFNGGFQLRARRVSTLDEALARQARLLRVKLNGVDAGFIANLQQAIASHRGGKTPLRLSYANKLGRGEIELGNAFRVRASADLKRSLDALPGVLDTELLLGKSDADT